MATESQTQPDLSTRSILSAIATAYDRMEMSTSRYILIAIVPSILVFVSTFAIAVLLGLSFVVAIPLVLLGLFVIVIALVYPKLVLDQKQKQVRQRFHLFLTHITVLSMTNIDRVEVFRTLADEDEYEALAEEMGFLVGLIDTWNQSLDDACRIRSKHTQSPLLADFLERLAYTVGGGQQISEFLMDEQDTIMDQFVTRYEADLAKLDVLKELYMSLMLSMAFILVFAIVLPILVGTNPMILIAGTILMFAFVQMGFVYGMHSVSPYDPIWYVEKTAGDVPLANISRWLLIGTAGAIVLTVTVLAVVLGLTPIDPGRLPLPIAAAIPVTPLLYPGWMIRREELKVKDRDAEFPSFIRALGAVESVKQSSTGSVLQSLRQKDFGSLTANVDALYKRLNMRIDNVRSWRLFAAETGSYLIQKFGDMYVVARQMGGDPKLIGKVISDNHTQVLKVREKRQQATTTITGVLYGITATSVFSFFIGLEIVDIMIDITDGMDLDQEIAGDLVHTGQYNLVTMEYLLVLMILVNAALCGLMIRVIDRGHILSFLVHFVFMTWLGAVIATITQYVVSFVISV